MLVPQGGNNREGSLGDASEVEIGSLDGQATMRVERGCHAYLDMPGLMVDPMVARP